MNLVSEIGVFPEEDPYGMIKEPNPYWNGFFMDIIV